MSRRRRDARRDAAADRLHSAAIHLLRGVRKADAVMGLGPAKSSALSVLVFGGPRSLGALAAAEGVKPPSMTRVVQELVAERLVTRRIDPEDRRVVRLEATARARRILNEGRARRAALLADWLGQLDDADVAKVEDVLPILERLPRAAREVRSRRTGKSADEEPSSTRGEKR
jgi:DNA-binding MarR family transcriptional regulator